MIHYQLFEPFCISSEFIEVISQYILLSYLCSRLLISSGSTLIDRITLSLYVFCYISRLSSYSRYFEVHYVSFHMTPNYFIHNKGWVLIH